MNWATINWATRILMMLGGAAMITSAPVSAQSQYQPIIAYDLTFFERAKVGPLEITPFGVVRDQRCADARFCYRPEDLRISVILHDQRIPREVVLTLGQATQVPGGVLVLRDPGTRPRSRGALALTEYALDIEFIPTPRRGRRL
ncbi:hypothetical protein [uncultured Erythrobacter sp.]|uniref:hypothetical protein n=1 Tax=uncultured Erythrobacter sp. TaxID=263913 RepID=UPI002627F5BB|nr:hypothetical protein [uncultured Erythrobacter sp.]